MIEFQNMLDGPETDVYNKRRIAAIRTQLEMRAKGLKAGFNPNQQRDPSGRWGSGSWHKIDIKEQVSDHYSDPDNLGSTFNLKTGENMDEAKDMFSVGIFLESDGITDILDVNLTDEILEKYMEDNKNILNVDENDFNIGTWFGGEKGEPKKLWLDITVLVKGRKAAIELGEAKNQISIWDLENRVEIETGGTGKYSVTVMETKGNKKPHMDRFGKWIMKRNKGAKPMTFEAFMNRKPKK